MINYKSKEAEMKSHVKTLCSIFATCLCFVACGDSNEGSPLADSGQQNNDASVVQEASKSEHDLGQSIDGSMQLDLNKTPDTSTQVQPDMTSQHDSTSNPPVITGGKIVLNCPASGFHKPPPITIASLPSSLLPRCSNSTKTCVINAATSQAYTACLVADTTPPVSFDGELVDCEKCDLVQGRYCLASACTSEFADFGCCAQENGSTAACQTELNAVINCAKTTGKSVYEACLGSLVTLCFP